LSWADYVIGPRVSLNYFYLIPVILAAWRGNRDVSLFLVFAGGIGWFVCEWPFGNADRAGLPAEAANAALLAQLRPDPLFRVWEATMLTGFLAVVSLLTCRLRETFERERSEARTDALTGLANRRTFCERLDHEIERMRRTQRPFTLAVIDLDNFKYVNDHFGHLEGDEVLRVIARHMLDQLRVTDLPGRTGGDEFALLLTETDATGARTCLMELLTELTQAMKERNWPVGCSIGAVTFRVSVASVNEALHLADEQMYAAKRAGKGRLEQEVYFGPSEKAAEAGVPAPVPSAVAETKAQHPVSAHNHTPVKPSSRPTVVEVPHKPSGHTSVRKKPSSVVVPPKAAAGQAATPKRNPPPKAGA
jgi:diguanylate cyclase (GGDEF)-like protein